MLKSTLKLEDETGKIIKQSVIYDEKNLHLGSFDAIEHLMESAKVATFPKIEGQLLLSEQEHFEKKWIYQSRKTVSNFTELSRGCSIFVTRLQMLRRD